MPFIEHNGIRALYIHVPKTGGTSIERWMARIAPLRLHSIGRPQPLRATPQHLRMDDIDMMLGEDWADYACMTVRNPFSRLESEYRMQAQLAEQGMWRASMAFGPWLEAALTRLSKAPHADDNHLRPQWEFGGDRVEVFRLEEGLSRPLHAMARQLGVPAPKTPARALKSKPRPIRWRKTDILRVRRTYAEDFTTFGYDDSAPPEQDQG